jgi:hypothetical protein
VSVTNASSSNIALPVTLIGILLIFVMIALALFLNPGGAAPPAADRRTFWYSRFASSDHRWLAASSRWVGKTHRLAVTGWRRGAATATWLLGR